MRIPKPRVWWGVIWPSLKLLRPLGWLLCVLLIVGTLVIGALGMLVEVVWLGGRTLLERHAEHRTAIIRSVRRNLDLPDRENFGATVKGTLIYMNDGTVWEMMSVDGNFFHPAAPSGLNDFLAGDAVRYENPAVHPSEAPNDELDYCFLYDQTTGWEGLGYMRAGPFAHARSSCPSHRSTGDLFWSLIKPGFW